MEMRCLKLLGLAVEYADSVSCCASQMMIHLLILDFFLALNWNPIISLSVIPVGAGVRY